MTDFPCDFRSEHADKAQKCEACGPDKNKDIEVFECGEFNRPCSVHAHNLREGGTRTGRKMLVCIKCDARTVDGVRVGPLGAVEIQRVRRQQEQPTKPPCDLLVAFAANVTRLRGTAGLAVDAAATAAGCNAALWTKIEMGGHWPSPERLTAIAESLGVHPASLLS